MQSLKTRGLHLFNGLGLPDQIGVACMVAFLVLLLLNLVFGLISDLAPGWTPGVVRWLAGSFVDYISLLQWLFFWTGVVLLVAGGPRRRQALLEIPKFCVSFIMALLSSRRRSGGGPRYRQGGGPRFRRP